MKFDMKQYKKIHFIGIGGISMGALAMTLADRGYEISGSDKNASEMTEKLKTHGVKIYIDHRAENVKNVEAVIYTGAISMENSEIKEAKRLGIPIVKRTELMNNFLEEHKINIAVSGTHGKTTTSCMTTAILERAGLHPDFLIGAIVPPYNSSHRLENSDYLVVEACEYQANFLDFRPSTIIVNNIDYDHVDYYNSIEEVVETFRSFAKLIEKDGHLLVNKDDVYAAKLLEEKDLKALSFGIENEADFMARDISSAGKNRQSYDFYAFGKKVCRIELSIVGLQNVYNSLAAFSAIFMNGIDITRVADALIHYSNALRRFELLKRVGDAVLISDYAHHPAEIAATLRAARSVNDGEVICAFQPHTYTRTKRLLPELASCFELADKIYIADIDPIREEDIYNISSMDLVEAIRARGKDVSYLGKASEFKKVCDEHLKGSNMVIAMGAGEIDSFARMV